ncbi:MAG: hypothetical protein WBP11_06475 [Dokdonella sp.]
MKIIVPLRLFVLPALALAMVSCGKKDESTLLTYIPADSPYVFAVAEAPSKDMTDIWLKRIQPLWPIYDTMLARLGTLAEIDKQPVTATTTRDENSVDAEDAMPSDDESGDSTAANSIDNPLAAVALSAKTNAAMKDTLATSSRIARELVKDLRGRDTSAKMSETGLAVPGRAAFYGVGVMPVARFELASADAFRAWIGKIETTSASKFSTAKLGDQDYWFVGNDKVQLVLAIQDQQLVVTLFPGKANDALRQSLLGIVKPQQSLADSGELGRLIDTEKWLPVAAGWVDFKRMVALYPADPALVAIAATFDDKPLPALSDECRADFDAMVDKAPRMIFGYRELSADRINTHGRWQLAPDVATDLMALAVAPTATGGDYPDALFDMAFNVPVLKLKDFALKQAKAIVAQPYRCDSLQPLNKAAAESVEKLSAMLPPPFSDITGVRVTVDSVTMPPAGMSIPDIRGKLMVATNNPSFLVGLAQMAMPALANIAVTADGKPVEIPTKDIPAPAGTTIPPVHVAMAEKALAFAFGAGEAATLASYVNAPMGTPGEWVKTNFSGEIYTVQGEFMQRMQALMPDDGKTNMDPANMAELYKFYSSIFKRLEGNMSVSAKGIEFEQNVEMKP